MNPFTGFEIRVLLCSAHPQAQLRALDCEGIYVCGIAREMQQLPALLCRLQPHVLMMDDPDAALSALPALCLKALPAFPPRIISCHPTATPLDSVCPANLPDAVYAVMQPPMGRLAFSSLNSRLAHAHSLLDSIGMPAQLKGRADIALGAAWLSTLAQPVPPLQHQLYPWLAQHDGVTPAAIERRIRSAIESAWLHGSLQAQNTFFGLSVSPERGKPTNAELLFRLSDAISARITEADYTF